MQNLTFRTAVSVYLPLVLLLNCSSCDRVRHKGEQVSGNVKNKIAEARQTVNDKKEELKEKFDPTYDYKVPDTKPNKGRFKQHLGIEPTNDVKNIYAYGDFFLGLDYKVLIAFSCDKSTIEKIIQRKDLQPAGRKGGGLMFLDEFSWWDKNKIDSLEGYRKGIESEYWEYLWYDPKTKRAFYEEYSM